MTVYARPGAEGSLMTFQSRYDGHIGGERVPPGACRHFENRVTGQPFSEVRRSDAARGAAPRVGAAHVSPEQVRTHGVDYESVDDDCLEKR
jgi:hypothetical protein